MEGEPGRSTEARVRGLGGVLVRGAQKSLVSITVLDGKQFCHFGKRKGMFFFHCVGSGQFRAGLELSPNKLFI